MVTIRLKREKEMFRQGGIAEAAQHLFEAVDSDRRESYFDEKGRLLPEVSQYNTQLVKIYMKEIAEAYSVNNRRTN